MNTVFYKIDEIWKDEGLIKWIKAVDIDPILKKEAKSIWNQYIK